MPTTARSAYALAARAAAFVVVALLGLAGAATASPGAWWSPLTATGCAGAASSHVGLVVDFGTVTDAGTAPTSTPELDCVSFSSTTETGSDVLVAAHHVLSFDPRTGLLCSIDGYPSSGCGKATGGGYEYWSYWHGGSTWTYATTGPDGTRMTPGGVEGWRFVAGKDSSSEHAPRYSPAGPCPKATPTTTPRPPTATTAPATAGTAAAAAAAGHASPDSTVAPASRAGSSTTLSPGTRTTPTSGSAEPVAVGGSTETTGSSQAESAAASGPHRPGSGSPAGAIAVAALVGALGVGAFVVSRVRSP